MARPEKLAMHTPNLSDENYKKLAELFPGAVTETIDGNGGAVRAVDADVLAQEINARVVSGREERYQFTWPGKRESVLLANAPVAASLRPVREDEPAAVKNGKREIPYARTGSVNFDATENLYIEGDNLDVLKLLRETYLNRVKMIYIDPPYNTGNDFVYRDDFSGDAGAFLRRDGQYDGQGNRLERNLDSSGRFHTDWLNMMYPRLRVARDLLADDGVIFVSIDDHEVHNLRKILDEIFGSANFVAQICHKSRASISNDKIISPNHNMILFYAKDQSVIHEKRRLIGLDPPLDGFDSDDGDGRGAYRLVPVDGPGGASKGNPHYEFLGVTGYFRFSKATMREKYDKGYVVKRGNSLYQKYYLSAAKQTRRTDNTWWDDGGLMSAATSKLKALMGGETFDTPKPTELIVRMLKLITFFDKDSLILDFFSGSATTAHAVMQLNAEDGGRRKFIMVQIPEPCPEGSGAAKAGYADICEIGKERIRRAGAKIREENRGRPGIEKLDTGFRVLKLDSGNRKDVCYTPEEYAQMNFALDGLTDNIKEDRTDEDLLFQAMLDLGIPLSGRIEREGRTFAVDGNRLIACFGKADTALLKKIAQKQPRYAVFRDSGFLSDSAMVNFEQVFAAYSPKTIRRVL